MSLRIDVVDWIAGSLVIGNTGLGVLAQDIPSDGTDGGSFLYNDLNLPVDNDKEIRALILTPPSAGTLVVYEDGGFSFTGAPDGDYSFTYQLYVDGVAIGSPATVNLTVGAASLEANAVSGTVTSATITTSIDMLASALVVAATSANLSTDISMSASALSEGVTSANLSTDINMSAGALTIITTSADLSTAIQLSAQAVMSASSSADLTTNEAGNLISANGVVNSTATANLTTSVLLNAVAQAVCTGYASLTVGASTGLPTTLVIKFKRPNYKITFK